MKEDYTSEKHHGWIISLSIFAVLLIGVGIFFYYTFLRQSNAELIEAIPTDAAFIFEVNDNETLNQTITPLTPYFNEMLALDILPAYQTIYHKLPGKKSYPLTISSHKMETGTHILFNTRMEKSDFKRLLRALSIDPANFTRFEQYKIYTYGTNYKSLKFVYFNHILTLSDDIELVKKALIQSTHPKNLVSDDIFKGLYELTNKNTKQNWVMVNNKAFGESLKHFFTEKSLQEIRHRQAFPDWSAFQLRISKDEIFLSGYTPVLSDNAEKRADFTPMAVPEELLPFTTRWYNQLNGSQYSLCQFSLPGDSANYEYLIVMQDTVRRPIVPMGSVEKADEMRNSHPNGIYPVTDSTFTGRIATELKPYHCFIERNGCYLFAASEEALAAYSKALTSGGVIANNPLYKFSKNNVASSCLAEFNYYNVEGNKHLQHLLTPYGMASLTAKNLLIFSASCTNIANDYAAVNVYVRVR